MVWPFDGSFWRDELGGYTYDIKSRCEKKHFPRGWKVTEGGLGGAKRPPGKADRPASKRKK